MHMAVTCVTYKLSDNAQIVHENVGCGYGNEGLVIFQLPSLRSRSIREVGKSDYHELCNPQPAGGDVVYAEGNARQVRVIAGACV